jgi:protein phosphatase
VSKLAFRSFALSHVGCVRKLNEDSVLARPEIGLWGVADGMGGHGGGDLASATVVAALAKLRPPASAAEFLDAFETCVADANEDLRAYGREQAKSLVGTTLVAVLIFDLRYACVWCGDSRAYLLRDGELRRISRDHSEVQELLDRGVISAEQARTWPRRNVVTRALGAYDQVELEIVDGPTGPGDRFLLCSDGLTGHLSDAEIEQALAAAQPEKACERLVQLTLQRGASDNVSVVVVDCGTP